MMIKKKNHKNKIVYNNYQFYENAALTGFLEKQATEGYSLCGAMGRFLNILKFCYDKTEVPKSYAIFRKYLDEEIDENIENMKTCSSQIIYQNDLYIVFENASSEVDQTKPEIMEKKQNVLLGVPIKKSIAFISMLLVISVISLVLKILLIEDGNLHVNFLSLGLYLALIINFLLYFIGDLHDIIAGKGISIEGKLYFSNRTKFKDILFRIGDILKFGILLGSICISVVLLLKVKDGVILINVLRMWLIYCIGGFSSRLRYQRSYISLLLIEVFLITLSFW